MFTADMIEIGYNDYGKRLREESLEEPLKFYITNNMFDETKLYIARDGGRAKKRRTVAQACQIAYQKPHRLGGRLPIHDKDIVRPPALVQRCTAAACAGVVGNPKDPFGIMPDAKVLPKSPYYGFGTETDSHTVNRLVSKWISLNVDELNEFEYRGGGVEPAAAVTASGVADLEAQLPEFSSDPASGTDPLAAMLADLPDLPVLSSSDPASGVAGVDAATPAAADSPDYGHPCAATPFFVMLPHIAPSTKRAMRSNSSPSSLAFSAPASVCRRPWHTVTSPTMY